MEKVIELIKKARNVAILPHVNADGDAIGSCMAMREALRGMGRNAEIYAEEEPEARLRFISDGIVIYSGEPVECDTCVVLDCGDEQRIGERKAIADSADTVVCIDHHKTNTGFGTASYIEPETSSTGEILFKVFRAMGIKLDRGIARYLYAAICSDTGCFAYSNVSPDTFRIAAELISCDIDHAEIARELFDCVDMQAELLKSELTSRIRSYYGGRLRTVTADEGIIEKYGVSPREVTDLVNLPRRIRGTEAAVSVKFSNGAIRASLRSNGETDVSDIAAKFGGGGHCKAAGCTIDAPTVEDAERMIVEAFREKLI